MEVPSPQAHKCNFLIVWETYGQQWKYLLLKLINVIFNCVGNIWTTMEVCKIIISGTITRHYGSQLLYSQLMSFAGR